MPPAESPPSYVSEKPLAWLFAAMAPVAAFAWALWAGGDRDLAIFAGITALVIVLWMFSLVADFIPALLALLLILLFGLAPGETALSGFSSTGFLLALSIMGLGAVIASSGLAYRYTLTLLAKLPTTTFAHQLAIFFTALVLNPVVPTIAGRAVIVCPAMNEISKLWDPETRKHSPNLLYTSGIDGIALFSPIFLTAAPANFLVFGLLPPQEQQAFEFLFWAYAASLSGLVLLVLYFLLSRLVMWREHRRVTLSREEILKDLERLGPLSWPERASLIGIGALALGILTASLHKVPVPYLTFAVLCSLLFMGALTRDDFVKRVDWAFLSLLAGLVGVLATMKHLGVDQILVEQLAWLGEIMRNDFELFVLILSATVLGVRLLIPLNSAILIVSVALIPVAEGAGVSPWVVGFMVLLLAETAFFGYQSPYILLFRSQVRECIHHNENRVRLFHALLIPAKLAAIYASIPFWTSIGVL